MTQPPPEAPEVSPPATAPAGTAKTPPRFVPRLEGDEAPVEEWMLSYSDMVTLLLTMFVALLLNARYDLPTPDRAGFGRDGSQAAAASGSGGAGGGDGPGSGGGVGSGGGPGSGPGSSPGSAKNFFEALFQLRVETPYDGEQAVGLTVPALPAPLYTQPDTALAVVKDADLERIRRREAVLAAVRGGLRTAGLDAFITAAAEGDGVRLNIPNSILFGSGTADLQGRGPAVLKALAPILTSGNFTVAVEGHTDNQAIATPQYPSNWELSASRAAAVARMLIDAGVAPQRLEATGFADSRPLMDNTTEDGRKENRRVTLLLRAP